MISLQLHPLSLINELYFLCKDISEVLYMYFLCAFLNKNPNI